MFGETGHAWLAGVADVLFYGLLALGILGLPGMVRGRDPAALAVPLTVAYFTLLHTVIFPGDPRYHVPLLPMLAVSAATWLALIQYSGPWTLTTASAMRGCSAGATPMNHS